MTQKKEENVFYSEFVQKAPCPPRFTTTRYRWYSQLSGMLLHQYEVASSSCQIE